MPIAQTEHHRQIRQAELCTMVPVKAVAMLQDQNRVTPSSAQQSTEITIS